MKKLPFSSTKKEMESSPSLSSVKLKKEGPTSLSTISSQGLFNLKAELLQNETWKQTKQQRLFNTPSNSSSSSSSSSLTNSVVTKQLDKTKFIPVPSSSSSSLSFLKKKVNKSELKSKKHRSLIQLNEEKETDLVHASLSQEEWTKVQIKLIQKQTLYETLCQTGGHGVGKDGRKEDGGQGKDLPFDEHLVRFGTKPIPIHAPLPLRGVEKDQDQLQDQDHGGLGIKKEEEEDPWMEVEDEFGRTRHLKVSEFQAFQQERLALKEEEEEIEKKKKGKGMVEGGWPISSSSTYYPSTPLHFDASLEVRTLGVSFYQFSQHEEERALQMEALKKQRMDTLRHRALSKHPKKMDTMEHDATLGIEVTYDQDHDQENLPLPRWVVELEHRKKCILQKRVQKLGSSPGQEKEEEGSGSRVRWLTDL
ncbi:hypothetical protein HMI56_001418 [Coelomomyces lativittatus]|nr:hypothetical protein HMI56_001418 [Coelomomyces lativittatus]